MKIRLSYPVELCLIVLLAQFNMANVFAASEVPVTHSSVVETSHSAASVENSPDIGIASTVLPASSTASSTAAQDAAAMSCYQANSSMGNTIVCAMKPSPTIWISTLVSIFALIISIGGLMYGLYKDRKSRLQSIEDDYWIRKVISPIALEPLIKKITETVSAIPDDRQSQNFNKKSCKDFGIQFQSDWAPLASSVGALALLDREICKTAMDHVSNIEDEVLRYCSNNATGKIGEDGGCISRAALQETINAEMLKIMNCIRLYQVSKI